MNGKWNSESKISIAKSDIGKTYNYKFAFYRNVQLLYLVFLAISKNCQECFKYLFHSFFQLVLIYSDFFSECNHSLLLTALL